MQRSIRLSDKYLEAICQTFTQVFRKNDHLWLFGSRVYPEKKGGDIDLYVETSFASPEEIVTAKLAFLSKLKLKIGEQKIDLVVRYQDDDLPIYKIAKTEGVQLI